MRRRDVSTSARVPGDTLARAAAEGKVYVEYCAVPFLDDYSTRALSILAVDLVKLALQAA